MKLFTIFTVVLPLSVVARPLGESELSKRSLIRRAPADYNPELYNPQPPSALTDNNLATKENWIKLSERIYRGWAEGKDLPDSYLKRLGELGETYNSGLANINERLPTNEEFIELATQRIFTQQERVQSGHGQLAHHETASNSHAGLDQPEQHPIASISHIAPLPAGDPQPDYLDEEGRFWIPGSTEALEQEVSKAPVLLQTTTKLWVYASDWWRNKEEIRGGGYVRTAGTTKGLENAARDYNALIAGIAGLWRLPDRDELAEIYPSPAKPTQPRRTRQRKGNQKEGGEAE